MICLREVYGLFIRLKNCLCVRCLINWVDTGHVKLEKIVKFEMKISMPGKGMDFFFIVSQNSWKIQGLLTKGVQEFLLKKKAEKDLTSISQSFFFFKFCLRPAFCTFGQPKRKI